METKFDCSELQNMANTDENEWEEFLRDNSDNQKIHLRSSVSGNSGVG